MKLTAAARKKIPTDKFADQKNRKFPLTDKKHIQTAETYERFASPSTKKKIDAAARKAFGKNSVKS